MKYDKINIMLPHFQPFQMEIVFGLLFMNIYIVKWSFFKVL